MLRNNTFEAVEGYDAGYDLVIHKHNKTWRISDRDSGLLVKGYFKTYREAKEAAKSMPDDILREIYRIRTTSKYKEICKQNFSAKVD